MTKYAIKTLQRHSETACYRYNFNFDQLYSASVGNVA